MRTKTKTKSKIKVHIKPKLKPKLKTKRIPSSRNILVQKIPPKEYETIVEFSFNIRQETLVIRFLNGDSYALKVENLPKKMLTKKPNWETSRLAPNKNALLYDAGNEIRQIPAHTIHSKGRLL